MREVLSMTSSSKGIIDRPDISSISVSSKSFSTLSNPGPGSLRNELCKFGCLYFAKTKLVVRFTGEAVKLLLVRLT